MGNNHPAKTFHSHPTGSTEDESDQTQWKGRRWKKSNEKVKMETAMRSAALVCYDRTEHSGLSGGGWCMSTHPGGFP